jgi:hypothetical protein
MTAPATLNVQALKQHAANQLVTYCYDDPGICLDYPPGFFGFVPTISRNYCMPIFQSNLHEFYHLAIAIFHAHQNGLKLGSCGWTGTQQPKLNFFFFTDFIHHGHPLPD